MPEAPATAKIPPQREPKQSRWIAPPGVAGLALTAVRLPARGLEGLIWLYQRTISPALVVINPHGGCRFAPTCSHYARVALREHGFLGGVALTLVRLAKCGPWHPGGEDPVPSSPRLRRTRSDPQFSCVKVTRTPLAES
jgi:putative membrane protein insertion efficiency factor